MRRREHAFTERWSPLPHICGTSAGTGFPGNEPLYEMLVQGLSAGLPAGHAPAAPAGAAPGGAAELEVFL